MNKDDRLTQWQEIEAATLDETVSEEEQAFRIGRRDGYSEAVRHIDMLTGGDGEYRYCLGLEDDERHCPDPDTMIARIATRLEALQAQPVGEGKLTMTISLTEREQEAIERLMAEQELSRPQIFKCALREYQMGHERRKAGETISWSGDEQRLRDFAGPALTASQPVVEREAIKGLRERVCKLTMPDGAVIEAEYPKGGDWAKSWSIRYPPDMKCGTTGEQDWELVEKYGLTEILDAAILALTPVEGVGERKTGWLIERDDPQGLLYRMASRFDRDHMKALRFARREDAQAFCDAFLTDHRHTVAHPQYTRIAEHAWD